MAHSVTTSVATVIIPCGQHQCGTTPTFLHAYYPTGMSFLPASTAIIKKCSADDRGNSRCWIRQSKKTSQLATPVALMFGGSEAPNAKHVRIASLFLLCRMCKPGAWLVPAHLRRTQSARQVAQKEHPLQTFKARMLIKQTGLRK